MRLATVGLLGILMSAVALQVKAAPAEDPQIVGPLSNWLVGVWQVGRGAALCDTLRVETDNAGNIVGFLSSSWDRSPDRLVSLEMSPWPHPATLSATFENGRIDTYALIPSPPGEWDFIKPDAADVQRIDVEPDDPYLLVRVVEPGGSKQLRYHRVDRACGTP